MVASNGAEELTSVTPRSRGVSVPGVAALALALVFVVSPKWANLHGSRSGWIGIGAAMAVAGLAFLARAWLPRLYFNDRTMTRTAGPIRRSVDLTRLSDVTYRRSSLTGKLGLTDQANGRLTLDIREFNKPEEWVKVLREAIERCRPQVDPRASECLEHPAEFGKRTWMVPR